MGRQQIGNQFLFAALTVASPGTPDLQGNNGAFAGVVNNAAGRLTVTMAPDAQLEPTDIIEVQPDGLAPATAHVEDLAEGSFDVTVTNGQGTPTNFRFSIAILRTFRG